MQENRITSVTASSSETAPSSGSEKGDVTSNTTTSTSNANDIDQAQFEADKRSVYKHPLFSLLALLLEKCEQATQGYVPSNNNNSSNSSSASSPGSTNGHNNNENDSFSRDIQAFVQLIEKEKRPLLTNNAELDGLMIKALQVLRIHLLELEKVQELCRDFCTRYIACLRGKMQSENLLRSDYAMEHINNNNNNNNNMSNSNSPINSPNAEQDTISSQQNFFGTSTNASNDFLTNATDDYSNNNSNHGFASNHTTSTNGVESSLNLTTPELNIPVLGVGGGGIANATITSGSVPSHAHQILGSTPLSQIGCPPMNLEQYSAQLSPSCGDSEDEIDSELESNTDDLGSNYSMHSSKRQKRGILPKHATSVMRAWLFQHLVHPYPTEDEKRAIAAQTNLTLLQVNNWFINARRRILTPMLEHASDSSLRKKSSPEQQQQHTEQQISAAKRFWNEQLALAPNHHQPIESNIENISSNINRLDSERFLAVVTAAAQQKLHQQFYSSDDSNDESLIIDQQH